MKTGGGDSSLPVRNLRLYLSGWFRHRILSKYLKPENENQVLLDIGGGDGSVSRWFQHQFRTIIVLDNNIDAVKQIHDSNLYPVLGDARCLPFKDNCCQRAMSVDFQEHLSEKDIPQYLKEIHRVLKKSGVLAVFTSCRGFTIRRWLYILVGKYSKGDLDWADWAKDGHLNRLSASQHRKLAQEAGFLLTKRNFYGHLFDPLVRRFHSGVVLIISLLSGRKDKLNSLEHLYRNKKPSFFVEGYFWILKWVAYLDGILLGRIPGGAVFMKLVKKDDYR
jgi:ubiquinone/menaquinone biosynthesis C-methylase UbiE